MSKKIAVIDGNSLMHRAFHAVPDTMNAADGTPTNAVFGFMSMLLKFVEMAKPDAVVCAFDAGKPAFRIEALEQYKAQRPPMDDRLRVQFPVMEELLESMAIPVVKVKGWEGDDVLGTIAARDEALGFETLLVTGDKDAYQLASDLTRIVTTKKGITDVVIYGPAEVEERYGVTPAQFPDYLGLMGDSSDNIPGVPGVGAKTATKFLQEYGSIEGLYENLDKLKGKMKEKVRDNRESAFLSRQIATIVRDLDFECDLEGCAFPAYEPQAVSEAFEKYQLSSPLSRLLKLVGAQPETPASLELSLEPVLTGAEGIEALERALANDQLVGVAFAESDQSSLFEVGETVAFAMDEGCVLLQDDEGLAAFARLVQKGRFAVLDAKAALHRIYPKDGSKRAMVSEGDLREARLFDLGLAGYVLNSSHSEYSLGTLAETYLGGSVPVAKQGQEVLVQAAVARALVDPMTKALQDDGSQNAYFDIDLPLVAVLAIMERTGAAIDVERLSKIGVSATADIEVLRSRIFELAGEEFNIDSPMQLSRILFEVKGYKHGKKNQRGYSTDASVLKELAKEHELAGLVLKYRELAKIKSTYIDALPRMQGEDGLVHTSFNETVTTTGRLSSSDPNLQNIPVRTEFGRKIRDCFVPLEKGSKYLSADYSQIELRLLAHLSGDEGLISAFVSGEDLHASTASRVFGVPLDDVTPELRSRAKAVNFGIVYGQQAYGLSQSLDVPFSEAKEMIERYFAAYPGVRAYLDGAVEEAKTLGYATSMYGRKRHIPELRSSNAQRRGFGERTAMNHPMQGSAADIIKLAMVKVQERLETEGFKARLMIQVHDELDFSVPEDEIERLSAMVREVMENVAKLKVPLVVDVSWGDTWAESH